MYSMQHQNICDRTKEGEAGEEIYPAQLTQWQKLGVEVYYLGATYKCNMYDSKGVLKVAKHFLDDKGNAITSKELPDGTFSFGLYEYKNAQTDYSKEQKLQILTITNKMVHYLTNAMENQWISHSLPDYLLEASLVYLNLMKMKIRSWTVVQVISRKKVLHTRLLIKKIKQRIRSKRMEHQKL